MVYVIYEPDGYFNVMFIASTKGRALDELKARGYIVEKVEEIKTNQEYKFYGHMEDGEPYGLKVEVHKIV